MTAILLDTSKPMPTLLIFGWSSVIIIIILILKTVKKKMDSSDTGAGKSETWTILYHIVRIAYAVTLFWLMYIMVNWLFL